MQHDEENPVNWGKEEVDSWLQLQWPQLGKLHFGKIRLWWHQGCIIMWIHELGFNFLAMLLLVPLHSTAVSQTLAAG